MSSNPVTATENMKLEEVANLFQDRYITRVPGRTERQTRWYPGTARFIVRVYEGISVLVLTGC